MRKTDKDDDSVMGLDNLTEAFLEVFCHKLPFGYNEKNGKGRIRKYYQNLIRLSTPRIQPENQI